MAVSPTGDVARISCFLVKIASHCNLACDYCYVYFHADQGWRYQPKLMSSDTRQLLAARIGEYVRRHQLDRLSVVFHGGEPLLAGSRRVVETSAWVRSQLPSGCRADFSLQTNGTLLDRPTLDELSAVDIGVSLSIDGPASSHNRHRLDHQGRPTHRVVEDALKILTEYPRIFAGVIAVIDPATPPGELLEYFSHFSIPRLDLLLPDANHDRPPPGREADPGLYERWLLEAFDLWFDRYSYIPLRTFDSLIGSIVGLPSETDAFGSGDVSLLTIETDGTYHDLDVLKITAPDQSALHLQLRDHSVAEVVSHHKIQAHRLLLRPTGLATQCQSCPVVEVCGGGTVPHRYSSVTGFANPTIYCREMLALIPHIKERLVDRIGAEEATVDHRPPAISADMAAFHDAEAGAEIVGQLLDAWRDEAVEEWRRVLRLAGTRSTDAAAAAEELLTLPENDLRQLSVQPSVVLWTEVGRKDQQGQGTTSIEGEPIVFDPNYAGWILAHRILLMTAPRLHRNDPWLRQPFAGRIVFEDEASANEARMLVGQALETICAWSSSMHEEILHLSPEIQFIRDTTAHPDKLVSFSDNAAPGALYMSVRNSHGLVSRYDLGDSIVHEHRHQKLYLLQRSIRLVERDWPLVHSPWREDPRPPSGLLHAMFVFATLLDYWRYLAHEGSSEIRDRAVREVALIEDRIRTGAETARATALTPDGRALLARLEACL